MLPANTIAEITTAIAGLHLESNIAAQILAAVFAPLHLVASAKLGAAGAFSIENTKLIEDLVGRAPITTKQFVEDFKSAFS